MTDGPIALCGACRRACFHREYAPNHGHPPLDSYWSHFVHPRDDHDAEPLITDWADINERICIAAEENDDLWALTCPFYQGVGTCGGGASCGYYGEPICQTDMPTEGWHIPAGWTPERLKAEAERREGRGRA